MIRSMPMQFWPEAWKVPLSKISTTRLRSRLLTESRMMEASLPPSSATTGMSAVAAEAATLWQTGRDPMKVIWLIEGWLVRRVAVWGQQTTDSAYQGDLLAIFIFVYRRRFP